MPTHNNKAYISNKFLGAIYKGSSYQYYEFAPETELILARAKEEAFTIPNGNTILAMDILIKTMKVDGSWYKEDSILNFAYNNTALSNFSLINWKNPMSVTNLVTFSRDWSNASWGGIVKTPNTTDTLAPDGSQTACKFANNTTGTEGITAKSGIIANAPTITYSIYTKGGTATGAGFLLRNGTTATDFDTGNFSYSTGLITGTGWTATAVGNGWYRLTYTRTTGISVGDSLIIYYGRTGNPPGGSTASWYVWGAQVENRDKASRYTPTGSGVIVGNGIATIKGGMTYTVNGWESNGATGATAGYIETKFNPVVNARNFTQNNAGMEVIVAKAQTLGSTRWLIFNRIGYTNYMHITNTATANVNTRINSATQLSTGVAISGLGYKALNRTSSSSINVITGATQSIQTDISVAVISSEIILLNDIPDGNLATDAGIAMWSAGASKTFAETQTRRTNYNAYLTKIGLTPIA